MKLRKILPVLIISLFMVITAISASASLDPNIDLAKNNWGTNAYAGSGPAASYTYSFGQNWAGALNPMYPPGTRTGATTPSAIGVLNVAVIFMDATDRRATAVTQTSPVDYRTVQANFDVLSPLPDFFWQSSYGQLKVNLINVNAEVNNNQWFNGTRTTSNYGTMSTQVNEAVAFAFANGFDFSDINYAVVFSPRGGNPSSSMTSHGTVSLPLPGGGTKSTYQYFNIGNNIWSWRRPWTVLAHEMGHTLNMIDLYTYEYIVNENTNSGSQWFQFIGGWDVEGDCNAESPDQLAWHKYKVRWLKDEQVKVIVPNSSQEVTLTANAYWDKDSSERADDGIKMIYIPTETVRAGTTTKTETAYVIESRRPIGNDAPGPIAPGGSQPFAGAVDQGVLIYRLDSLGPNGGGTGDNGGTNSNGGHGRGGIKVIDGNPDRVNNKLESSSTSLRRACFGFGTNQVQTFVDEERGITIQVLAQDALTDTVLVTYGNPTLAAGEGYMLAGDTATVDFSLGNSIGLTSAGFNVCYDPALVKPVSYDTSKFPAGALVTVNLNFAPGKIRFAFANEENINLADAFFSLTFEAMPGAAKVFDADITIEPLNAAVDYEAIKMGPKYQARNSSGTATFMMPTYLRLRGITPITVDPLDGAVSLVVMGDVSGDGEITPEDAILVLQYYVGLIELSPKQLFCANVSGNNDISPVDAALILRLVVGG